MLSSTAWPSLLRLEITAGLSHHNITPLTHSHHPLAHRRPHCHYTVVCVCVCVIYVYSTFILFHIISDAGYLRLPTPLAIPAIRRLQCITLYTPTSFPHPIQVLDLLSSRPSNLSLLDLTTPGRKQCHNRPIRHLWSLPNVRPFFARAAKE